MCHSSVHSFQPIGIKLGMDTPWDLSNCSIHQKSDFEIQAGLDCRCYRLMLNHLQHTYNIVLAILIDGTMEGSTQNQWT